MKAPEPTPPMVSSPPQPPKVEVDSTQSADSGMSEEVPTREEQYEEKVEAKSPVPEPIQQEYQEPPHGVQLFVYVLTELYRIC